MSSSHSGDTRHPSGPLIVSYQDGQFVVAESGGEFEVVIETPIALDDSFDPKDFSVHTFLRRDLKENSFYELWSKTSDDRFGFIIPALTLGSAEHDLATKSFFQRCSYVVIKAALEELAKVEPQLLASKFGNEPTTLFSSLFHENVCFLLISRKVAANFRSFSLDRLIPSLFGLGFVPSEACRPSSLAWEVEPPQGKKIAITPVSTDIDRPELVNKLCLLAASAGPSKLVQFFYLYQVFEYLMECVQNHKLPILAANMVAGLGGRGRDLHDEFISINNQMREKDRLHALLQDYSQGSSHVQPLADASLDYLQYLNETPKGGIGGLYAIRNFLFHRTRHLPEGGDEYLGKVVNELALFIPALVGSYKLPPTNQTWPLIVAPSA